MRHLKILNIYLVFRFLYFIKWFDVWIVWKDTNIAQKITLSWNNDKLKLFRWLFTIKSLKKYDGKRKTKILATPTAPTSQLDRVANLYFLVPGLSQLSGSPKLTIISFLVTSALAHYDGDMGMYFATFFKMIFICLKSFNVCLRSS